MYLPRALIAKLYLHLQNTRHPLSPPVLVLVALEPDALCACRILTRLFKHDYIPHKIQPVAGYADLERVGRELVVPMTEAAGGAGGVVVCLGVGGMADLGTVLGLEQEEGADGGAGAGEGAQAFGKVEVWVVDSHRPWNLSNVFGGFPLEPETEEARTFAARAPVGVKDGCIERAYRPGKGGIVVFDDGDIEEGLAKEREAYLALVDMPDVEDDGEDLGDSSDDDDDDQDDDESDHDEGKRAVKSARAGQKRKSWDFLDEDSEEDDDRPRQRRRSNSSSPIPDPPRRPAQRGLISLRDDPVFSSDGVEPPTAAQPPRAPSARTLRRRLLRLRRKHESVLRDYYRLGTSYSEPISSMMYSLASELGREDNDLLWLAIVGVTSMELYGRSSAGIAVPVRSSEARPASGWLGMRGARIRQLLRDEVRRLNPPEVGNGRVLPENTGIIPTTARSPEDTSIRLSPEPKFLLIRHWSLYDSMLHSPYLFSRLKTWSESGLKRLHKLLAKMGVSLVQCKQSYAHMDMMLKRELRTKLLKYASLYNLDELIPSIDTDGKDRGGAKDGWGFVRSWGWRATLSAQDVGVVIGALLEVGKDATSSSSSSSDPTSTPASQLPASAGADAAPSEEWVPRFWQAYDALEDIEALKAGLPTAQLLHRAIFATGTAILKKRQISHLRAFRMCVVKDAVARGPDAALFCHPGALTKLALWIGEALAEQEREATGGRLALGGRGTPLVVASLDEKRGVYVVVGTGGGGGPDTAYVNREAARKRAKEREEKAKAREAARKAKERIREEKREARRRLRAEAEGGGGDAKADEEEEEEEETESEEESEEDEDDDEEEEEDEDVTNQRGYGLNRFGIAFQDVVSETKARVRIDSFEHCVVEVKKEDLGAFLESLSMKAVVG
ncbi:50f6531d-5fc7-490b-8c05-11791b4dcdf5 [Thermothielavioides terrestris]|uniref:50f6531d-5fc7-490b-8c05-11791b4dcdf5 n=1 Tax=Thermothielavioides terrestris TaxID=2587410 RepID=A0A3S4D671_9PEZI|nr:50f6531d-5fc7-490b-8c05-11791b4dcdf5 [Thermothielavioides terrestris]